MIRAWIETQQKDELGRLFVIGDVRTSDLLAACHSTDDEIVSAAFFVLQLLGKPEGKNCADSLSQKHDVVVCAVNISDACFNRIEEWFARKGTANGYDCGDDKDEPFMPFDDSLVYALVLDGSPRSRSVLDRMVAFEKACKGGDTIIEELLEDAQSLIVEAKENGQNLSFEPDTLQNSVRASAFFLPSNYRKNSEVEVIAHNKEGDRVMLEVSYMCGLLCGRGYYVVLRKDDTVWQYAFVRMAWIS
jgi:hypothetical protein